jgi:Tfp pilus assembly protein PilN
MDSPNLLDLNDQGEQPQPQKISRTTIILWLLVLSLAAFFVPLFLLSNGIRGDVLRLEGDLQPISATLAVINTPPPEIQQLLEELTQAQGSADEIEQTYLSLMAGRADWPAVMAAIGDYDPARLTLTSLAQTDNRLTLNGRAIDDSAVVAYARDLEESQLFARVVIQSVSSVATPFATPQVTGTVAPGTTLTPGASVTPTITSVPSPSPRDDYETDDFEPRNINLGQPQRHNFHPIYDVDNVKFLAKAGRYYRIYTFDLNPGVDTFLTVSVGGTIYTNDDAQPTDLSSEIKFQVLTGRDAEALVKITNRGQYSPDTWYQIAVEELLPTPTPPPTSTPVPVPTATPTNTPVPPNTPTPTPDLRDKYEPDDTTPTSIAVGETQTHNFYPDGDVDKMSFIAKAGRHYQVLTSELALGVDTYLEVAMGDQRWSNDDYDLPGTGNYASAVCFQAPSGDTATMTVTNREQQYGPDKRYDINVSEAPVLEVNPSRLDFGPVQEGGANPPAQQISVVGVGESPLVWEAETNVDWLDINPSSGTAPTIVQVAVDASGLTQASYEGHIIISGTTLCTANSPQTVTVTLQIGPPTARLPGMAVLIPNNAEAVEFVIVLELKAASP